MKTWEMVGIGVGAGFLAGCVVGGSVVGWYMGAGHVKTVTKIVAGPSRVVTRRIVVYRKQIVAAKTIVCGSHHIQVTAKISRARSAVHSRRMFNAYHIHLHVSDYRPFLSFRPKIRGLVGYGANMGLSGGYAGPMGGVSYRVARVGSVNVVGQAFWMGGVTAFVAAEVKL